MMIIDKNKTKCSICGTKIDLVRMHKDEIDFIYPRRCPVCGAVLTQKNIVERLLSMINKSSKSIL